LVKSRSLFVVMFDSGMTAAQHIDTSIEQCLALKQWRN